MLVFLFWIIFLLWLGASVVLVFVVLIQSGKGGGLSGLISPGTSLGDQLGATGAEKTLNRWTSYCAIGFLVLDIAIVLVAPHVFNRNALIDQLSEPEEPQASESVQPTPTPAAVPAAPAATAAPAVAPAAVPAVAPAAAVPAPAATVAPATAPQPAPAQP